MDTWLGHHLPSQAGLGDGGAEGCLAGVVAGASHYGAGKKSSLHQNGGEVTREKSERIKGRMMINVYWLPILR